MLLSRWIYRQTAPGDPIRIIIVDLAMLLFNKSAIWILGPACKNSQLAIVNVFISSQNLTDDWLIGKAVKLSTTANCISLMFYILFERLLKDLHWCMYELQYFHVRKVHECSSNAHIHHFHISLPTITSHI